MKQPITTRSLWLVVILLLPVRKFLRTRQNAVYLALIAWGILSALPVNTAFAQTLQCPATAQCTGPFPCVSPSYVFNVPCWCEGGNVFVTECEIGGEVPFPPPNCCWMACRVTVPGTLCGGVEPPTTQSCTIERVANASTAGAGKPSAPKPPTSVGEPVSITTGAVFFTHIDASVGDLIFARSYNSDRVLNSDASRYGVFGLGWNNNFESRLIATERRLEARTEHGNPQYYFDSDLDGIFDSVLPHSIESWIERTSSGYKRIFRAGGEESYDAAGRLVLIRERSGLTTTYARDIEGRLSSVSRLGRSLSVDYVAGTSRPWHVYGPNNILLATYTYDTQNRLDKVEYPGGSGYQYSYDPMGRILTVKDLEGKMIEAHTYYLDGRARTSAIGSDIKRFSLTYQNNQTVVTDSVGNVTTYDYTTIKGIRMVTKVTGPCSSCGGRGGDLQEWTYDDNGRIKSYKNGEGDLSTYTYDLVTGDLLTETHYPNSTTSLVTTYTYHPDGRLASRTDPRGAVTTWRYETVMGEEKETTTESVNVGETRTTVQWRNALGKLRLIIDPLQRQTKFFYTPRGDIDAVQDSAGKTTQFNYDALGNRTHIIPPVSSGAKAPILEYNVRGQIERIINPTDASKFTRITYDKGGRRKTIHDPLNRVIEYGYDNYGRLKTETHRRDAAEGPPLVTAFDYDNMSNVTLVRDARGKETRSEYLRNRLSVFRYPKDPGDVVPREEKTTYDLAGRIKTFTDRRGVVTTFTYDGMGRLNEKTYTGPISAVPVTYTYDEASNLKTISQMPSALAMTYDLAGQLTQVSDGSSLINYAYLPDGQRKSLGIAQTGFALDYDYDDAGRLWHIRHGADSFSFEYDDASRQRSRTFPNGISTAYTPDALSRLERLTVSRADQTLHNIKYVFDDVGNQRQKTMNGVTEDYGYDSLYRLDTVRRGATLTEDYGYDQVGNRKSTLARPDPDTWVYSDRNELKSTSANYQYDANGNLVYRADASGIWNYEWDVENQLTRVLLNGFEAVRFRYDPLGRRIEKTLPSPSMAMDGSARHLYSYDGADLIRETILANRMQRQRQYIHGPDIDEPLAVVREALFSRGIRQNEGAEYYHADALGSIVSVTDAAGNTVQNRSYDAFGNSTSGPIGSGFAFTGREWNPEIGLYYYRARYYDPMIGRFISEDPIKFDGDINFYSYVGNDPINFTDPSGLRWRPQQYGNRIHTRIYLRLAYAGKAAMRGIGASSEATFSWVKLWTPGPASAFDKCMLDCYDSTAADPWFTDAAFMAASLVNFAFRGPQTPFTETVKSRIAWWAGQNCVCAAGCAVAARPSTFVEDGGWFLREEWVRVQKRMRESDAAW